MRAAEAAALEAGRTLLVLDTVTGSDAERLYTRLGWQRCGEIPGYALWPQGGRCSTTVFYREPTHEPDRQIASSPDKHDDPTSTEVIGIDHIYIAVSDVALSEKFYDRVMGILGFRKNTFPNDGVHHIQYYNRHLGQSTQRHADRSARKNPGELSFRGNARRTSPTIRQRSQPRAMTIM